MNDLLPCAQCCVYCTVYLGYHHELHSAHLVVHHFIWYPKRRRKVLVEPIRDRLEQLIREVAAEYDEMVIELEIQPTHVRLSIWVTPYTLPSAISRLSNGRNSHHLRAEFLSSAGNVSQDTIQKYIERQSKT